MTMIENSAIAATRTGRRSSRIVAAVSSGPPIASPSAYALNSAAGGREGHVETGRDRRQQAGRQ